MVNRTMCFKVLLVVVGVAVWCAGQDGQPAERASKLVRVGAGQFRLETDLAANLAKIQAMLAKAAQKEVDIVVFPECALTGYPTRDKTTLDYVDQERTEAALTAVQQTVRELGIATVVGTAWRDEAGVWRNRALLIDETGVIVGHYDKIHGTKFERQFFADGERLPVLQWRGIKVGLLICVDMRFPEVWRLLRQEGVSLMFHSAAAYGKDEWKVPVLEGTMRCRAAESGFHIVSCNNAGPIPMMVSGIYTPLGLMLAKGNYAREELLVADIDASVLKGHVKFEEKKDVYRLIKVGTE